MPASFKVVGVAEALAELRGIDPALKREAVKGLKKAAEPVRSAVAAAMPGSAPLSGMRHKGRTAWPKRVSVVVQVSGRKRARGVSDEIALVKVVVKGAGPVMADMAGNGAIADALGGAPSRWVWPAAEGNQAAATKAVLEVAEQIVESTGRNLAKYGR